MAELIAYFSRKDENYVNGFVKMLATGNTEIAARIIQRYTGADCFKIEPVSEYSWKYQECLKQARRDQSQNVRPQLRRYLQSIEKYETIYLGFPNYWSTMPMAVFTFLEAFDFSGKIIRPFCTHEGSGLGCSEKDIRRICPGAVIEKGLAIWGGTVKNAESDIKKWLKRKLD